MLNRPRYEYRVPSQKLMGKRIVTRVPRFYSIVQAIAYIKENKESWTFDEIIGGYTTSFLVDDFKVLEEIDYTKVTVGELITVDFVNRERVAA